MSGRTVELEDAVAGIAELDVDAMAAARERLASLTKPQGSLGRLEDLVVQLAGITGDPVTAVRPRTIVVSVADHGVAGQGVSAYPQVVTGQMVANFLSGGAAVAVLARGVDADLVIVDAGLAAAPTATESSNGRVRLVAGSIRAGTADISAGPAMGREQALAAIDHGLRVAREEAAAGTRLIAIGEMGIGNTTAASALVAALTGRSARDTTGRGTGVDDAAFERKVSLVERALWVNRPDPSDPVGVLASLGGLEIGVCVGVLLGAASAGVPVLLDGFVVGAAALVAAGLAPRLPPRIIAATRSPEPGHQIVLDRLGLQPLLDLGLRLGEASGAALAIPLLDAACALRDEMATFSSAGVSDAQRSACSA
jgi:nicotinate-nucleotide--dimethylbenzimidazole phosphoribosyltransferase